MLDTSKLRLRQMIWEAEGVLSLLLCRDDGGDLPEFSCGAHIDLVMRPGLIRPYSLCGDPADRRNWKVAVLLEEDGRGGSRHVHTALRPGMQIDVAGPRNNFPLVDAPEYLFVAGGIGITPILSMIMEVERAGKKWRLLYGGRSRNSMAFLDELAHYGDRVEFAPQDEVGLLNLRSWIEPLSHEVAVYCCGPEPLLSAVESMCAELGRPPPHVERFAARAHASDDVEEENRPFEVVLAKSGRRFNIGVDEKIVDVLEAAGVWVPTSCCEGICGVCETPVVDGIPDHRDDYLTPEQRAENKTVMVCVGRSRTPVLVLDI